ncbi:teichoic acid D-Ala incorporation-associated protein DltX [Vagococcus acidifermentans]|uniref:Teichoic acid D-Ala incorporation-associated protein DltX n=1 Tax=Vagococcus acidifermentans TaxID=564710 RepID=A0A430B0S0_9ENTE|nr:teichoic acid D-Ala incorporation-associated protein DltX [Vagococcus acidifermentans]RSU13915.1 teichoic acid D-Ala incorporation-associated protein DltX [Vagococcus acidifermentans]
MKQLFKKYQLNNRIAYSLTFVAKTLFYLMIMLALLYMYHFSHVGGDTFIYNQF